MAVVETTANVAVAVVLPGVLGAGNVIVGAGESFLHTTSGIVVITQLATVTAPLMVQFEPVLPVIVGVGIVV